MEFIKRNLSVIAIVISIITLIITAGIAVKLNRLPPPANSVEQMPVNTVAINTDDPVRSILDGIVLKEPIQFGGMTIIPLSLNVGEIIDVVTLEEALKRNILNISELKSGAQVNTLLVQNTGKENIFIMAGEILTGCKQDRILKDDILLIPNSGQIEVSAFCTEHGRWTQKSDKFSYNSTISPQSVRKEGQINESQNNVWKSIENTNRACSVSSNTTGAMNYIYGDPKVQNSIRPYFDYLINKVTIDKSVKGVIVIYNGNVSCIDLFGNHEVFKQMWPKLLKAYILDYLSQPKYYKPCYQNIDISTRPDVIVKRFVDDIKQSKITNIDTPGAGILYQLESSRNKGKALLYNNGLIHMVVFSEYNGYQPDIHENVNNVQQIIRSGR